MLNLNSSLANAGVPYATLWSEEFSDSFFLDGLGTWPETEAFAYKVNRVWNSFEVPNHLATAAQENDATMRRDRLIMGVFDEGCMGLFNAIVPDHMLHLTGVFKERLLQYTLYYEPMQVPEAEGRAVLDWLETRGLQFEFGEEDETELTCDQVNWQGRMYVATVRIAHQFCCDAFGIQYQQGIKDLLLASDLVEGC